MNGGLSARLSDLLLVLEDILTELETTQGRVGTTGAIVLAALIFAFVLLPFAVRSTAQTLRAQALPEGAVETVDVINAYIPTTLSGLVLRLFQLWVLVTAALLILVTWGMVDVAFTAVTVIWSSLPFAGQLGVSLLVIVFIFIGMNALDEAIRQFSENAERITEHQEEVMIRVGHLSVLLIGVTGLLTLWGFNLSGILVGAGALSVVIGLGARKTIGRMISGFVLMFTRPFTIGNWVEIGDGQEGIVTEITIMHTSLRGLDGEVFIMPNDVVGEKPIRNLSRHDTLRLRVEVGVDYDDDTERAETVACEAIEAIDVVLDEPEPSVISKSFADSAVLLELRFWIANPTPSSKVQAIDSVVHAVKSRFAEEGIKIPYPQRELSGRGNTEGIRIHPDRTESAESVEENSNQKTEPNEPESESETNEQETKAEAEPNEPETE